MSYINDFTQAYIGCALWSSTDSRTPCWDCNRKGCDKCEDKGYIDEHDYPSPLDENYDDDDLATDTRAQMEKDCLNFIWYNRHALRAAEKAREGYGAEQAGHDYWLTRNGHGAGFWDRGLGTLGDELTDAAHANGEFNLYVGDDLKIHN